MCGHGQLEAPHSRQRFPVWLQRFPHRLENNRCRRAVQHGEAASGSTVKKPWPKPVHDSQKARIPAKRALHPFPEISAPGFPGPKEYSVDRVSTTKQATQVVEQFGAENVRQTPRKFYCLFFNVTSLNEAQVKASQRSRGSAERYVERHRARNTEQRHQAINVLRKTVVQNPFPGT